MPIRTTYQRLFAAALVAAATPFAIFQVLNRTGVPFDGAFDLAYEDVHSDLVDGEVAAG